MRIDCQNDGCQVSVLLVGNKMNSHHPCIQGHHYDECPEFKKAYRIAHGGRAALNEGSGRQRTREDPES